jgi:hypothetical protein
MMYGVCIVSHELLWVRSINLAEPGTMQSLHALHMIHSLETQDFPSDLILTENFYY